jgi:large subunit ribosomal protein L35
MPKQKIRKSVAKRFRITPTGKVLRRGGGVRHLSANKNRKRLRRQRKFTQVPRGFAKKIKKALGFRH